MPLIAQRIRSLLGGVSQLPQALRSSDRVDEQINGLSRVSDGGPSKRPGSEHLAKLTSTITGYASAFVHSINLSNTQRYLLTIANESIRLFDRETGVSQAITYPLGNAYIAIEPVATINVQADTFTDVNGTDLTDHESEVGGAWTQVEGSADAVQIQNNVAEQLYPGSSAAEYRLEYEVPQDDYTVSMSTRTKSASQTAGLLYLKTRGNGFDESGYGIRVDGSFNGSTDVIRLGIYKFDAAGGTSVIANGVEHASLSVYDYRKVSIRVTGNFIEGLVDDVVLVSGTDASSPITSGGYTSVRFESPSTVDRRWLVNDYEIDYTPAALVSNDKYRAVTVDDRTYVVNTSITVDRGTEKADTQTPTAILYVEQADYGTVYSVTVDGETVSYETVIGTDAGARREIATDYIAQGIREAMESAYAGFTIDQFGSMIRIFKTDGTDFNISATDGLADNGLVVIKGSVQSADDLPLRCIDKYVVEVQGADDAEDNYWVKFDVTSADDYRGIWKECARPGEAIAFDETTMPHELVFSDELSYRMRNRGFPRMPVVSYVNPVRDAESWEATLNGGDIANSAFPVLDDHEEDFFVNLEDTNGGPVKVGIKYNVDTTKMTSGETLILTIAHNDGVGSTVWTVLKTLSFAPGVYKTGQIAETDISAANLGANYDLRVQVTYSGGATPASKGKIILAPNQFGVWYYNYSAVDVTWPTDIVYPKGTVWTVTVDGTDAAYTQTADITGAAIVAALEPTVEAIAGRSSTIVTNENGTAIRITKDAGGLPVVTVAKTFSNATHFWNPDVTSLETSTDAFVGKILRNLSDGSEGTITASYATGITVGSLTGGTDNEFNDGDLCIIADSSKRWVFRPIDWSFREAGDSVTNPWPSIMDRKISEVFYHRGRLGFTSGGNVLLSEVGKPENLFRTATTQLLDSDPIDVKPASSGSATFTAATEWDGKLVLWTDSSQWELSGEPLLTPSTVALKLLSRYPCSTTRPIVMGSRLYFTRGMARFTRVFEYKREDGNERPVAEDITLEVPRYLDGAPELVAGDAALGMLLVRTDTDPSDLYVCHLHHDGGSRVQTAWSRWEFDASSEIVGMDFADGVLALVFYRADAVYLETIDLDEVSTAGTHLDRKIDEDNYTDAVATGETTWTLPYSVATDGSEGVVQVIDASGNLLTTTRPSATTVKATGDYTAQNVTIGLKFTFEVDLSTIYMRDREGTSETRGRTQVRSLKVSYSDSRDFTVTVTNDGRAAKTYTLDVAAATEGELRVPVLSENKQTAIVITNATPNPSRITGLDWEGFYTARGQRV
jgi:hypothetical protein